MASLWRVLSEPSVCSQARAPSSPRWEREWIDCPIQKGESAQYTILSTPRELLFREVLLLPLCVAAEFTAPRGLGSAAEFRFHRDFRLTQSFPMAAAASISAVTASFTTLSSLPKSQNSSAKPTSVALPAFNGLKAGASSPADLTARVASQCVAASSASRGVVSMTADVATKFVTKKSEETFTAAKVRKRLLFISISCFYPLPRS